MGLTTERSEFESQYVQEFYLLHVLQTGSGPTQPPIQWVPEAVSAAVKRPGITGHSSLRTSAKVKKTWINT
jgi:hypothetical protein